MMKKFPSSQRGFALVIALSLMAFVLLLILSISTLVQVESQSASAGMQQMRARLNAQLGAMIALGDLQRYTGPDMRVTARADILLPTGADEIPIAGQSRWTGVWSSSNIMDLSNISSLAQEQAYGLDFVDGLHNRQARWLISGNETSGLIIDPETLLSDDITANLATVGGSVTDKSSINRIDTVKAPKVEILGDNNVAEGHYAYWVSDEGVKARVNMADPFLDSVDPEAEYYRTAIAQVADPTSVSNIDGVQLLSATSSLWKDTSQDPSKISSLKNIPMFLENDLPSGANLDGVSREFFHDFTVHSSGVLANTKDGGLKRDLSTALLSLPLDMSGGISGNEPSALIFPRANPSAGNLSLVETAGQMDPGGPKWEQLSDYYKLAKNNSILNSEAPINLRMPTNEQVGFTPVITRSNFFVQGFADRNPAREADGNWVLDSDSNPATPPGTILADWEYINSSSIPPSERSGDWYYARGYRYSLAMFPHITLWNPYDRAITFGDLGLEIEMPPINIVDGKGSTSVIANTGQYTSKWNSTPEVRRNTVKFVIRGTTIEPGQAVNFSPHCNSYYNATNPEDNVLVAGASPYAHGFFTPPVESSSYSQFWETVNWSGGKDIGKPIHLLKKWNGNDYDNVEANYDLKMRSRLSLNFEKSNQTIGKQLVMLYNSSETSGSQFPSENRFKTIQIVGSGKFVADARQPHVILTTRLGGLDEDTGLYNLHITDNAPLVNLATGQPYYYEPFLFAGGSSKYKTGTSYFDDFVGPEGHSAADKPDISYNDTIVCNQLSEMELSRRAPFGAFGVMKFPRVPDTKWYGAAANEVSTHLFLNMNPTAPVIHKESNLTYNNENKSMDELRVYGEGPVAPWKYNEIQQFYDEHVSAGADDKKAYVGLSNTPVQGSSRMVLFEVPDTIPLSIGQLAHANLMNFDINGRGSQGPAIGNCVPGNGGGWNTHTLQTYATPTYAIGNSLANPLLSLRSTEMWSPAVRTPWVSKPAAHYDYSYKLNDALWDEYFFSGITDANPVFPLPNSRLRASSPSYSNSDLTTQNRAAANLLLDGAFNINSTSVAAWEAVLGAMREIETLGHSIEVDHPSLRHNFSRFNEPLLGTPANEVPSLSSKDSIAAGFRNLSDAQIASLASEIVNEIRLRKNSATGAGYPFLSLSEFINRSPTSDTQAFALRGALQAAIDKANLNGLESSSTGLWAESEQYPLYYDSGGTPVVDRPKADGMPGSFMQSDLLAKIGAFIQARSDTFTIRSYGSTQEQFGSNEDSRAYYEIVVQRTPSYVGVGDIDYEDSTQPTNQKFGRRYEIKSQRWVSSNEI